MSEVVAQLRSRRGAAASLVKELDRQLEAATALLRALDSMDAAPIAWSVAAEPAANPPEVDTAQGDDPTGPPSRRGALISGSLPNRIFAILDSEPERVFAMRELAEAVHERLVSSKELETVRRSALRLVSRGRASGSSADGVCVRRETA